MTTRLDLKPIHQVVQDDCVAEAHEGHLHTHSRTRQALMDMYASMENIRIDRLRAGPLFVRSSVAQLPNVKIAQTVCRPCKATRDTTRVADANDDVIVCLVTAGTVVMIFDGSEQVICKAGEVYVGPNDRSSGRIFTRRSSFVDVALPRFLVAPFIKNADHTLMRANRPSVDLSAQHLLVSYVRSIMREESSLSHSTSELASTHIQDLLIVALGAKRDALEITKQRGVRAARLSAIKADIVVNLTEPKLSLDDIARRHNISPQYIRELFRGEGTTVTDFVRQERLKRAYRKLSDSRFAGCSVSIIAFDCGFNDLSYFNRSFRRQYGMTPSDARMMAHTKNS